MIRYLPNCLQINYTLFLAILISSFLPTLYSTFRIFLLGSLPDSSTFSIVAQNMWIQLFYEIFHEGLLLPLYYLLGKSINNRIQFTSRFTLAFIIFCSVYFLISIIISYFLDSLIIGMQQKVELASLTKQYIQLEICAIALSSIYLFNQLIFYLLKANRCIYYLLIFQVFFNILFDSLFVSNFSISLQLGVIGIAYTNILVNIILIIFSAIFMVKLRIEFTCSHWREQYFWIREWGKLFLVSGGESFVRNIIFILMILRMVNSVEEAGTYWIANQFIWGWLLIPLLSLSTLIKIDVAENNGVIKSRLVGYFIITTIFIVIWLISMPFWGAFLQKVMNIIDYESVLSLTFILISFYIAFAYKYILESYFYGLGKIYLLFYQTLIVNFFYYGSAFLLYSFGYLQLTLNNIAYLFGFGLIFSTVVTLWLWYVSGCNRIVWGKQSSKKYFNQQ